MADFDLDYDNMDDNVSEASDGSQAFNSDNDDDSSDNSSQNSGSDSDEEEIDEDEMIGLDDEAKERMAFAARENAQAEKTLKLEVLQIECRRILDCMPYGNFHEVSACVATLKLIQQNFLAVPPVRPGQNLHTAVIELTAQNPHLLRSHNVESYAEHRILRVPAHDFIEAKGRDVVIDGVERKSPVVPNKECLFRSFMS